MSLRILLIITAFLCFNLSFAQDDFLAKQYFNDGDFEKATVFYEKLVSKKPGRTDYIEGLVHCYQQLEKYTEAELLLSKKLKHKNVNPIFFIEQGYNYALQNKAEDAQKFYKKAISKINKTPSLGYLMGRRFQKYALLNEAVEVYTKAMVLNPKLDFNIQLARIYGEQGSYAKMYDAYLLLVREGKTSKSNVLRNIDDFISEDATNTNNVILKRLLLQKAQKEPNILWNELLSWLFVKQKQYSSAFRQEKAIFKRNEESSTQRLTSLGNLLLEENETYIAEEVFQYILQHSTNEVSALDAELNLIDITLKNEGDKAINQVEKQYIRLMEIHGYKSQTLQLQIAYANFLTFKKNTPKPAISLLKNALELPLNNRGKAFIKLTLGDILVYDKKFNEALIYFSQIQQKLKNDVLGQEARYKVAQTSFYKGDFDWALTQLKVLRSSTSQLIANDAMQLSLLISDNSLQDSTQTALKKYARADLLSYQNKTNEAITALNDILKNHKGEKIEDEALLKQAELLTGQKKYDEAKFNYQKIIEFYSTGILADDAHFAIAELYNNVFNLPEKAKEHYEKIMFNYQDSYYFPQARKNYRILRGDAIN